MFTHVDAVVATSKLVLLVEGKRTDALSSRTDWLPHRGQLARNLEAAGMMANGRVSYVMLALERPFSPAEMDQHRLRLDHLDEEEQNVVNQRFIGQATWRAICADTGINFEQLPDRVQERVEGYDPASSRRFSKPRAASLVTCERVRRRGVTTRGHVTSTTRLARLPVLGRSLIA